VEVLRGPQGTLYGRNSSSGVFNIITARPELEDFSARIEGTYGNYNTYRSQFMINVPVGETFALRASGFTLNRDGFTEDLNSGEDIDGRDMYSVRLSAYAEMSPQDSAHLMIQYFEEDSNRSRIGKQLCARDNAPWPFSQGCLAAPLEFETVNLSATLGGLGALIFPNTTDPDGPGPQPPIPGFSPVLLFDLPALSGTNPPDLREVFLTFQPVHQNEDFVATFEYNHDFGNVTFTSVSSFATNDVFSSVDYNQYIGGQNFQQTLFTPTGTFTGPFTGTQATLATFDESASYTESVSQEFRLTSDFDGPLNFTAGGIYIDANATSYYRVFSNSLEAIGLGLGIPFQDQYYYENYTDEYRLQASAAFGEVYYTPVEDLKFTLGLRYTSDDKTVRDRQTLLLGLPKDAVSLDEREASFEELTGRFTIDWQSSLPFTDDTNWYLSYARGYKGGGLNPPVDAALFAGVEQAFEPEFVNAYEIGMKNMLGDGRLMANFAGFYYDYEGYQITRIVNRTSVNANIDATVKGVEAELTWEPVDRLIVNLNVGWLDTEIGDAAIVDPINVTAGQAGYQSVQDALRWTTAMEFDPNGVFVGTVAQTSDADGRSVFVPSVAGNTVRQASLLDLAGANGPGAALAAAGILGGGATIATAAQCVASDAAIAQVAAISPALLPFTCQLVRGFPDAFGVNGLDGIPTDITGNRLPNTPEWTVSVGAQYTFDLGGGWSMTPRADFYYQADSFARIFNGPNDTLDSYSIWNATLRIEQEEGWYANLFVKNIADEDVITDIYLTDQSSGLFSNVFLLEPRTYGITLGRRF
jgi:outer membrane receptor protein involved in Fe transport